MIQKRSRKREAILSFLETRKDHPTAQMVYDHVKEDIPNISLGTVYRNLNQLSEAGIIKRLRFGEEDMDRFDADTSLHHHFICNCCHSVSDLPIENLPPLSNLKVTHFNGEITGYNISFNGICEECKKNQQTQ